MVVPWAGSEQKTKSQGTDGDQKRDYTTILRAISLGSTPNIQIKKLDQEIGVHAYFSFFEVEGLVRRVVVFKIHYCARLGMRNIDKAQNL